MSKTAYMRGLQNFISDIRSAQNKEQEQRRVDKELAKIRERFSDDKALSSYDRRKYVWKLLYIYMLGYDIEFGHKQAADLIPQQKYKDKQVGYMACSLLLQENDEFLRLTLNAIHMDLTSRNEAFETLALSFIGNVGGSEMAEALTQDVIKLLSSGAARPVVKKRAALALLRLIRKTNPEQQVVTSDVFSPVINTLLEERDMGLLMSVTTLLHGLCARNGPAGYEGAQLRLIKLLERLTLQREREVPAEYLYYGIPSPWLQCKCLRVLQFFASPETPAERAALTSILHGIVDTVGVGEAAKGANPNKANALHAILFEAISVALHLEIEGTMLTSCVAALGRFLSVKDPNVRYLALETLSRLALLPDVLDAIRHHQATVLASLKDADISIRKRAMDLLFTMCDASCTEPLVAELLQYLVVADFSMREELVLKIAILAEKFAPSVQWYVDVALQLLEKAGDFVSDDIWHRVVQLVTNNPTMQQYAASSTVEMLRRGAAHESLVCTAAYLLGEYGRLVADQVPVLEQFRLLHALFPPASQTTKGLLMTAYIKLHLADPGDAALHREVMGLFERYQKFMDAELQQRASEYLRLAAAPAAASAQYVMPMPKWQERESSLLRRLQHNNGGDGGATPGALPALGGGRRQGGEAGSLGAQASAGTPQAAGSLASTSPRLVMSSPAAAAPPPVRDLLLGSDSSMPPLAAAPGAGLMDTAFTSSEPAPPPAAAGPSKPTNPVDLLAELLADAVIAPAPAPPPAPALTQTPSPALASSPLGPSFPAAPAVGAGMGPGPQQQPPPGPPPSKPGQPAPSGPPHLPPHPTAAAGAPPYPPPQYTTQPQAPFPPPPQCPQAPQPPQQQHLPQPSQPPAYPTPPTTGSNPFASSAMAAAAAAPVSTYPPPPPPPPPQSGHQGPPLPSQPPPSLPPYPAQPQQQPGAQQPMSHPTPGAPAPAPLPSYPAQTQPAPSTIQPQPQPAPLLSATAPSPQLTGSSGAAPGVLAGTSTSSGVMYEGARPVGSVEQWYSNLLVKERGILYEDQYLQIGVQNRYVRSSGQLVLFLGNKHAEASLLHLQLLLSGPVPGLDVVVGPAPPSLAPKQQVQVVLQLVAHAPFQGPPGLHLAYSVAATTAVAVDLRLPVLAHKFVVPEPAIPRDLFFEQWKASSSPPYKCQEMVERASPASIAAVGAVARLAGLGVEHGYLDPSPYNEAGAGYFCYATPGGEQSLLVMVRIEGNPQNMAQFRVTVSSQAPQVSAQLKDLIVTHLKLASA